MRETAANSVCRDLWQCSSNPFTVHKCARPISDKHGLRPAEKKSDRHHLCVRGVRCVSVDVDFQAGRQGLHICHSGHQELRVCDYYPAACWTDKLELVIQYVAPTGQHLSQLPQHCANQLPELPLQSIWQRKPAKLLRFVGHTLHKVVPYDTLYVLDLRELALPKNKTLIHTAT